MFSGGSASAVSAAPATVSAANVAGEITVTASAVGGATGYQLYRADGTCTQANALDFQLVEHGNGPALIDALTQGGYTYAYKVRGVDANGEGPISACAEVVSTSVCSLLPQFDQTSVTATQPYPGECTTRIGWDAGQSQCPAALSLRYNVYRSTDPLFTPSAATLIAQGVGGGGSSGGSSTVTNQSSVSSSNTYSQPITINLAAGVNLSDRSQVDALARQLMPAIESLNRKGAR